jgi:hypothetical protein
MKLVLLGDYHSVRLIPMRGWTAQLLHLPHFHLCLVRHIFLLLYSKQQLARKTQSPTRHHVNVFVGLPIVSDRFGTAFDAIFIQRSRQFFGTQSCALYIDQDQIKATGSNGKTYYAQLTSKADQMSSSHPSSAQAILSTQRFSVVIFH